MTKALFILVAAILILSMFTGCLPRETHLAGERPAGFLMGIWHGWIAPISLIVGIFSPGVRVYEPFNSGWWYDFGFYIAIISGFGGISLTRKKASAHRDRL